MLRCETGSVLGHSEVLTKEKGLYIKLKKPSYEKNSKTNNMEERNTIKVSAWTWLAQGKLELQLLVVSQAAAGVRTTGIEYSRTNNMETDPRNKKGLHI